MGDPSITGRWILVTIGGLFLGSLVQAGASAIVPALLPEKPAMALFPLDLSLGLTLGALQARVLRRHLARAWTWAVATGLGLATAEVVAGFVLHDITGLEFGFYRSPLPEALTALAIVGVTLGACVGGAQWLVLYQAGYRARLWIPVTIAGLSAAIAVSDYLAVPEASFFSLFGLLIGLILGGGLYGLLTGLLLTRLISSQPTPAGQ